MLVGRLVSINPEKVKTFDLLDNMQNITIGRKYSCNLLLNDNRCSSEHCKIILNKVGNTWEIEVEDLSTNGTFLNRNKIGKFIKVNAAWNSQIDILMVPKVDKNSKIGFKLVQIKPEPSQKRKMDEFEVEKKTKQDKENNDNMPNQVLDTLRCQICMKIMYQPVSLYPCLHNSCGGCFSEWFKRAIDCPTCCKNVSEVKINHLVVTLIDAYVKNHPDSKRPQEELYKLDAANTFKRNIIIINDIEDIQSDGSAFTLSQQQQILPSVCKQCPKAFEGYKCVPNQGHIQCFTCKNWMPYRNMNQRCKICLRGFCNLYWKNGNCILGILPVESYKSTLFTSIRTSSIHGNEFEQTVTREYIRKKKLNMNIVSQEMMDDMEVSRWSFKFMGNKVKLNKQSSVCINCAGHLWDFMIYKYREAIENELDPTIKFRPNCWDGANCAIQKRDLLHTQKLNHICQAVFVI